MIRITLTLFGSVAALLAAVETLNAQDVRTTVPLATGWHFHQGDLAELPSKSSAGADWTQVNVPHTWNRVGYYIPDPIRHIHRAETINRYQGVAWYKLDFTPRGSFAGKRAWLQFDAASRTAEVWLNGKRPGDHRGGFSRFRLDATAALRPGGPNMHRRS